MRQFLLVRYEDETGISGVGVVASGVRFHDGAVAVRWRSETPSTAVYRSVEDVEAIHGHGGKTLIEWIDPDAYRRGCENAYLDEMENVVNHLKHPGVPDGIRDIVNGHTEEYKRSFFEGYLAWSFQQGKGGE